MLVKKVERVFESMLWNVRFVTLIAVIASLIGSFALFYVALLDVARLFGELPRYADASLGAEAHDTIRLHVVTSVAEFVDGFLFALVLLIFAFGIYELFIGKIDAAERSEVAKRILLIRSLDDLKERLAKVIFLILVVRYFESAIHRPVQNALDLLYLAVGIVLIAVGLYLTKPKPEDEAQVASSRSRT
ncbi:MAG: YqhA family protein [Vulcanimicrobiaceae bacterium]